LWAKSLAKHGVEIEEWVENLQMKNDIFQAQLHGKTEIFLHEVENFLLN